VKVTREKQRKKERARKLWWLVMKVAGQTKKKIREFLKLNR
jgi:hypothetical protein